MNDMIVKSVDVMGDCIMAAKDNDGNIWVGVRWVCDAIGMTEGQMKRQIKNIQKDIAFKGSGSNLLLNKGSGEREVFCIKIDYIPLWLAKITITDKTREERPEFADKLLEYQLKAKDILAAAFIPQNSNALMTAQKQIQLLAQGNVELNEKIDKVKEDVDTVKEDIETIKNDLPVLPVEADSIVKAVKKRGVEILGGKQSKAYKDKSIRQKLYNDLYHDLKRQFETRSYKAIKRKDVDKAIQLVEQYRPPLFLDEQIKQINGLMDN